jgi:hypothetical protein
VAAVENGNLETIALDIESQVLTHYTQSDKTNGALTVIVSHLPHSSYLAIDSVDTF